MKKPSDKIVFEKSDEGNIKGYLLETKIIRGRNGTEVRWNRIYFTLNTKDRTYSISKGDIYDAIIVGHKLQEEGYRRLTLLFKGDRIKISKTK